MSNFAGKGTTKFADVQILSRKSFRSFKSCKGKSCLVDAAKPLLFRGRRQSLLLFRGRCATV